MSYCDMCHVYDAEHTDGEPHMMTGRYYKPLLDYFYSVEVMGEKWCDYNWGQLINSEGDVVYLYVSTMFQFYGSDGQSQVEVCQFK